MYEELWMHKG